MDFMLTEADWDGLEEVLRGCARVTAEECEYLKNAFVATERMWAENIAKIATPRLVMLSEAPQFGTQKHYFYNATTSFGGFLHFQDAEAILGHRLSKGRSDKQFLLSALALAGFIVLDVFPFALNANNTPSITYRNMSERRYRELFQRTASAYFNRKRDLVLQLGSPHFFFRYATMKRRLGDLVDAELLTRNFAPTQCIGGTNMSLDREKLTQICHAAMR